MSIKLIESKAPAYIKLALYGMAGSGKTYTAAKVLSEFIKEYAPGLQLAMFDTEGGAGFVAPMVKAITGKPLMSIAATSFAEMKDFIALCPGKYVGLIDSATHPWRTLCEDYLKAKRSRVKAAGGNVATVRLSLPDWGPIKSVWSKGFSDPYKFTAAHLCYCGRCGDVWETTKDDEGNDKIQSTGKKMKIEAESAYEPSLLIEMVRVLNPAYARRESTTQWLHQAQVVKDRNADLATTLTGKAKNDPDLDFFRPYIEFLMGGSHQAPNENPEATFATGKGKNWTTIQRERKAILEEIKNDLLLAYPGQTAMDKKAKVSMLREAFGTSSWTSLEGDERLHTPASLQKGRENMARIIKKSKEPPKQEDKK